MRYLCLIPFVLLAACSKVGLVDQASNYTESSLIAPILLPTAERTREFSPLYALPAKIPGPALKNAPLPPVEGLAERPPVAPVVETPSSTAPQKSLVFDEQKRPIVFSQADLNTTSVWAQQAFYNAGFGVQPSNDSSVFRVIDASGDSNLIYLVAGSDQTSMVVVTESMQPEAPERALRLLNAALEKW